MKAPETSVHLADKAAPNALSTMLNTFRKKIHDIFEPEEVEVNLEEDHGKVVSYTYTKVPHKEVA